ncbi:hypothetical protein OS493_029212 [Desmophyllum pertusum]|uniref:Uncharacterized protein n=1 Tax=Desmophyllum pertusum TaxID=174260 RepID=A0A9X0D9F1_9CNID|nr:hypothetical protein OS493_029212 [Desmophyllum pertusum]
MDIETDWSNLLRYMLCATCSEADSTIYEPVIASLSAATSPTLSSPAAACSPIADVSVRSADESSLVDQAAASSPIAVILVLSADDSSLLDPDPGPVEPEPFHLGFTIVKDSTLRRKRKLIDNAGYTHNVKRQRPNAMDWQSTHVELQRPDGGFKLGRQGHNHNRQVGAEITATIVSRMRKEAEREMFKPASAIVNQLLLEELQDAPCPGLPKPAHLARTANRLRQKLRTQRPSRSQIQLGDGAHSSDDSFLSDGQVSK